MAWGQGWGTGFATGLQAGSQTAARAMQAAIDKENQEFLKEERNRAKEFQAAVKTQGAAAETTDDTGYRITDAQGNTQFVSAQHGDFGRQTYADLVDAQGKPMYTVSETPERYQQAQTKSGLMLGQGAYHPEAETGVAGNVGPVSERAAAWDRDKFQRLEQLAIAHDRPERAAQYAQIQASGLQKKLTEAQIANLPLQQRQLIAQTESAERANEIARMDKEWRDASESEVKTIEHYNKKCPDGSCARVEPNYKGTGMRAIMVKGPDGEERPVGKPYKSWEEGGQRQILSNVSTLAAEQFKSVQDQENKLAQINLTGGYHLAGERIKAGAKGQGGPSPAARAAHEAEMKDINEKFKSGEYTYEEALKRANIAGARIGHPIALPREAAEKGPTAAEVTERTEARARIESELQKHDDTFKNLPRNTKEGRAMRAAMIDAEMRNQGYSGGGGNNRGGGAPREVVVPYGANRPAAGAATPRPIVEQRGGLFDPNSLNLGSIQTPTGTALPPAPPPPSTPAQQALADRNKRQEAQRVAEAQRAAEARAQRERDIEEYKRRNPGR